MISIFGTMLFIVDMFMVFMFANLCCKFIHVFWNTFTHKRVIIQFFLFIFVLTMIVRSISENLDRMGSEYKMIVFNST